MIVMMQCPACGHLVPHLVLPATVVQERQLFGNDRTHLIQCEEGCGHMFAHDLRDGAMRHPTPVEAARFEEMGELPAWRERTEALHLRTGRFG
jgi:hypothetical protein